MPHFVVCKVGLLAHTAVMKSTQDITKCPGYYCLSRLRLPVTLGGTSVFLFVKWWRLGWRMWAMSGAPYL